MLQIGKSRECMHKPCSVFEAQDEKGKEYRGAGQRLGGC